MELLRIMEAITVAVTLFMYSTGIFPCWHMYKTGDTKSVPFLMFLLSVLSCEGMLHYGILLNNISLTLLNVVGTFLQCVYVVSYLAVTKPKTKPLLMSSVAIAYLTSLYTYLYQVIKDEDRIADILGSSAGTITTLIVCYPVLEIIENIQKKNAEGMPLVMMLGSLACSTCWLFFGLMLNDVNIYAPNIPGIAIILVKLYVFQLYSPAKSKVA